VLKRWVRVQPSVAEVPPRLSNRRAIGRALSRFAREQGRARPELSDVAETAAVLRMRVTARGYPEDVTVHESTGDPLLDASAQHVGATMRFKPARVGRQRVTVWITIPITYRFARSAGANGKT
jgi:TonB family protein